MNYSTVLGIFDHVDTTASSIKPLEDINISHDDIKILSVAPYPNGTFFVDKTPIPIWLFAFVGGICGLLLGFALAGGTQVIMNLNVGSKSPLSWPAVGVISYETTLLGCVIGTFIGLLWMIGLPNWTERVYDSSISTGNIGVLVRCDDKGVVETVEDVFKQHGAVKIKFGENDF